MRDRVSATVLRARAAARALLVPPKGWWVIPYGASDLTECGCTVGTAWGVPYVPIAWTQEGRTYGIQCLMCGTWWTRAVPEKCLGHGLFVDASHPEERARRARLR